MALQVTVEPIRQQPDSGGWSFCAVPIGAGTAVSDFLLDPESLSEVVPIRPVAHLL